MSYRSAKRLKRRILMIRRLIDSVAEPPSQWMKLCGNGRRHNWSVLASELVFVPCACCLAWRCLFIGTAFGMAAGMTIGRW